jgi:hypothetical protein
MLLYAAVAIATISGTDPSAYFWVLPLDNDIGIVFLRTEINLNCI